MTETLTVVIIASVVAACTSTLTGAFQHYFQYVQSLIWVAVARMLNIHSVEFHQSKINIFAGAIFDKLNQDSHCRSFTYKASSWADGNQHGYIFLPTPTWKASLLQVFMLGYYVYLPSDPKKSLSMLVPREAAEILMLAANYLDRNEHIPAPIVKHLMSTFNTDVQSTSVFGYRNVVLQRVLSFLGCSYVAINAEDSVPFVELLADQQVDGDEIVSSIPEQREAPVNEDVDQEYTLFLLQNKYLDKMLKPRVPVTEGALTFVKDAPKMYIVNAADATYGINAIADKFQKYDTEASLGLYYYDPRTSFHFSQLQEVRASNKELNLIFYLPVLDILEASLPAQLGGFEAVGRKVRASMLCDWVNFLNEISNSCFPFIALVVPEMRKDTATELRDESEFLKYARAVLHGRICDIQ